APISIRSGKDVLIEGRDLGGSGTRMGRVRADSEPSGTAIHKGVDVFAAETIDLFGPSGSLYVITSHPGQHDSKSYGGLIRITSLGEGINGSGNVVDTGRTASGDTGGTVQVAAKGNVNLNTAVLRAIGDSSTSNPNRGGGSISVRSYSGNVIWTNGTGDVRPVGSSSFVFRANDGNGGTDDATATITINPVNDPPTFQIGPTVTVLEDSGAQTITPWVTAISPGPADESAQTVTFTTTNSNNALFSVQPFVASNGTLTFTPAPNANGSATITVFAQDNGGIANGGNDTSASQTRTITVNTV